MQAKRLDLGADVVVIPSRDLVVIHPDLDYTQALGAVMGTLPDLHPDAAKALVEQVTPRPREMRRESTVARLAASAVTMTVLAISVVGLGPSPAVAGPEFGDTWQAHMRTLGLECDRRARDAADSRVCLDDDRDVVKVQGFHRNDADLYLVPTDLGCRNVLIFETEGHARRYASTHPGVERAGRVVIW